MEPALRIPDAAIKYILFQRTAYLRLPAARMAHLVHRLSRGRLRISVFNLAVSAERLWGRSRTRALYTEDMIREYRSIQSVLPPECAAVLDIGCGVAGIDVYVQRHYAGREIDFYLLDRTQVARTVYYLFESQGAFYNSLDVAKSLLTANGIAPQRVHLLEATDRGDIRVNGKLDVVLSLLSWGFHYPVPTYLERVNELLSDNGVVILDVRRDTDGISALRQVFPAVEIIQTTEKYDRVAAWKRLPRAGW
jgi:SAM-dependent methyltransferase